MEENLQRDFCDTVDELKDIREIQVDMAMPLKQRIEAYIYQVQNPYRFRMGDSIISIAFSEEGKSLDEAFKEYLLRE